MSWWWRGDDGPAICPAKVDGCSAVTDHYEAAGRYYSDLSRRSLRGARFQDENPLDPSFARKWREDPVTARVGVGNTEQLRDLPCPASLPKHKSSGALGPLLENVLPLDREVTRPRGSPERGHGADRLVENVVRAAIDLEDQNTVSLQSSMEEPGDRPYRFVDPNLAAGLPSHVELDLLHGHHDCADTPAPGATPAAGR